MSPKRFVGLRERLGCEDAAELPREGEEAEREGSVTGGSKVLGGPSLAPSRTCIWSDRLALGV